MGLAVLVKRTRRIDGSCSTLRARPHRPSDGTVCYSNRPSVLAKTQRCRLGVLASARRSNVDSLAARRSRGGQSVVPTSREMRMAALPYVTATGNVERALKGI